MEKVHEAKEVDLTGAKRGVWLVKVPKYLATKWKRAGSGGDVGKLKISKSKMPGGKPDVIFSLSKELAQKHPEDLSEVPVDHKFVLTGIGTQALSVYSLEKDTEAVPLDDPFPPEKFVLEGKAIQRAECRPMGDKNYMDLKRIQQKNVCKPERQVVQLDKIVQNYKPKAYHVHDMQAEKSKKEETKRSRLEPEQVHELLFAAFEKHQYYNVKDLVRITQQPITYLKEILKEICTYNMKAPHRNMWELKPEYRHYKSADGD